MTCGFNVLSADRISEKHPLMLDRKPLPCTPRHIPPPREAGGWRRKRQVKPWEKNQKTVRERGTPEPPDQSGS